MRFSVISPTFNRSMIVKRAIDSGFRAASWRQRNVVVDDASSDRTVDMLREDYGEELDSGLLKLVTRTSNGGSTAAKWDGTRQAKGDMSFLCVALQSNDVVRHLMAARPLFNSDLTGPLK